MSKCECRTWNIASISAVWNNYFAIVFYSLSHIIIQQQQPEKLAI